MDAASLSELLSTSTSSLASLHAQLGHPPEALEHALVALHDQLRAAVDAQLGHVKEEVEIVRTECESIASENERLRTALGEKAAKMAEQEDEVSPREGSRVGKRGSLRTLAPVLQPLLHRRAHLTANRHRLRGLYASRSAQCQKLLEQLDTFRPIMAGFIKQPSRGTISAPSADGQQLEDVSLSFVAALEGEIARCEREKVSFWERVKADG